MDKTEMMANVLAVFLMISVLAFSIFSVVQFVDGYLDRNTHGMIFWGLMVLIMRPVSITMKISGGDN